MFIYLDESGTLTNSDGKYFIIGTYTINDPRKVAKGFRKWQHNKFPRKLRVKPEVKFSDDFTETLRLKTLQYFTEQNLRIFYAFLKKENIPNEYYRKGRVHETGLLYTEIVKATLELYMPITTHELIIIRDQRTLKGVTVDEFNEALRFKLLPYLPAKVKLHIEAVDSTTNPLVQVADWICGALARYYENKNLGLEYYSILKPNIIGEKELFSEKGTNSFKK